MCGPAYHRPSLHYEEIGLGMDLKPPSHSGDSPGSLCSGSVDVTLSHCTESPGKPQSMGHHVAVSVALPLSLDNHLARRGRGYIVRSDLQERKEIRKVSFCVL